MPAFRRNFGFPHAGAGAGAETTKKRRNSACRSRNSANFRRDISSSADADSEEPLNGALQPEKDEIMRQIYEGNLDDERSADTRRVYRLVEKMFLKQDAILRRLNQPQFSSGGTNSSSSGSGGSSTGAGLSSGGGSSNSGSSQPAGDSTPNNTRRPRVSPHQLPGIINWDQGIPCTEPAGRQPREARRILIQRELRSLIMSLLKVESYKPPLPLAPPEARFPTLENFGFRWEEKERSIFNMLAGKLVVEQLCRTWKHSQLSKEEKDELPDMTQEHIRYLCRTHNDALKPDAQTLKKARLRNASASSRRQTLYENRLRVLDRFPDALMRHRHLIIRLGLQGTSSDEEDPTQPKVYLIKRHQELLTRVQVLKSQLDLVYNLWFKGPGSRGSQVHARIPSDKVSERPIKVTGLPVTCLNRAWLRSLSAPEREFYRFEGHIYDYSFPNELLKRDIGRAPCSIDLSEDEVE
ncbi:transmembrane protein [Ceratobasidium sp. AG-Ba]|nr:transmembrane protein [Ceratobasidium sp. AG-Ba]